MQLKPVTPAMDAWLKLIIAFYTWGRISDHPMGLMLTSLQISSKTLTTGRAIELAF